MQRTKYRVDYDKSDRLWKGTRSGATRASITGENKATVIERTKELAKAAPLGQIVIRRKDHVIQTEHTYGQDPERFKG